MASKDPSFSRTIYDLRYTSLQTSISFPEVPMSALTEYPDEYLLPEVRQLVAKYSGLSQENVMLTCGAAEAIDLIAKWSAHRTSVVLVPVIYLIPEAIQRACGRTPLMLLWSEVRAAGIHKAIDALSNGAADMMLWLVSPNNPTGEFLDAPTLELLTRNNKLWIVIDEAYYELSGWTASEKVIDTTNLIVIRTFSKGFGISGARCGYILSNPYIVREIQKLREPFRVSGVGLHYVRHALLNRTQYKDLWRKVLATRDCISTILQGANVNVVASAGNFITVRLSTEPVARELVKKCSAIGINLLGGWDREFVGLPPEHIRLAIREPFDSENFSQLFLESYDATLKTL